MTTASGLLLALASACALNWGFLSQHQAASALPELSPRHPLTGLRALFTHRRWVCGFLVGLAGWALYWLALALAPLSLVQSAAAGGLGVLALLVHFGHGPERLRRSQWVATTAAVAGLALLGSTLGHAATSGGAPPSAVWAWVGGLTAMAALTVLTLRSGVGLGLAAGLLYAAADIATKAAVQGHELLLVAVLAGSGLAFACLQLGFQRGSALTTIGLSTLLTNGIPIAAGVLLFGETLPGGAAGPARLTAFALVTAAAVLLATSRNDRTGGKSPANPTQAQSTAPRLVRARPRQI